MRTRGVVVFANALLVSACISSSGLSGAPEEARDPTEPTCSADLQSDVGNCGACGRVCGGRANGYGVCTSGACNVACNTGYADCNTKVEDGCEVTLATDSLHCGTCGHSCDGARCVSGQCQPVNVAALPGYLSSLASDATHLYFGFSGGGTTYSVQRVAKTALVPRGATVKIEDVVTGLPRSPDALTVDATHVYWSRYSMSTSAPDGVVSRAPKTGGAAQDLATGQTTQSFPVRVDSGFVYWVTAPTTDAATGAATGPSRVLRCPVAGCGSGPSEVATNIAGSATALDVDGSTVFFGASGNFTTGAGRGLYRCAASGCGAGGARVEGTPSDAYANLVTHDATQLYFAASSNVARVKKAGGDYQLLTLGEGFVRWIGISGDMLSWVEDDEGRFGPGDGRPAAHLYSCRASACDEPERAVEIRGRLLGVTADETSIYVASRPEGSTSSILYRMTR